MAGFFHDLNYIGRERGVGFPGFDVGCRCDSCPAVLRLLSASPLQLSEFQVFLLVTYRPLQPEKTEPVGGTDSP